MMSMNEMFYGRTEQLFIVKTYPYEGGPSKDPPNNSDKEREVEFSPDSNNDSDDRESSKDSLEEEDTYENSDSEDEESKKSDQTSDSDDGEESSDSERAQVPDSDEAAEAENDYRVVLRGMPHETENLIATETDEPQDLNEKTHEFRVPLCCAFCENSLTIALKQLRGVRSVEYYGYKHKVIVKGTAAAADLLSECRSYFPKSAMWNERE